MKMIWDCRDDKEGIVFDIANNSETESAIMTQRANTIECLQKEYADIRKEALGFIIEPLS